MKLFVFPSQILGIHLFFIQTLHYSTLFYISFLLWINLVAFLVTEKLGRVLELLKNISMRISLNFP
jgi:hypothetical protein